MPRIDPNRDLVRRIADWFRVNARSLPWREITASGRRDAYRSLVSELMLQQTQVARVLEKFAPFIARFPTIHALAAAPLDDVLAEWSGLGYYRRARHLHAAAQAIVKGHAGTVPAGVDSLIALPGIGRYTAGSLASIVFHQPAPIVDGNVARVLLRIRGKQIPQQPGMSWAWQEAERLVATAAVSNRTADFNEGLMELGALICTPLSPRCTRCPVANQCEAFRLGLQEEIPAAKTKAKQKRVFFASVLVRDTSGRVLLEKRPDTGLWAGMWQPPTLEADKPPTPRAVAAWFGVPRITKLHAFTHHTTHREVVFTIYKAPAPAAEHPGRRWVDPETLANFALGNAQQRIIREFTQSR